MQLCQLALTGWRGPDCERLPKLPKAELGASGSYFPSHPRYLSSTSDYSFFLIQVLYPESIVKLSFSVILTFLSQSIQISLTSATRRRKSRPPFAKPFETAKGLLNAAARGSTSKLKAKKSLKKFILLIHSFNSFFSFILFIYSFHKTPVGTVSVAGSPDSLHNLCGHLHGRASVPSVSRNLNWLACDAMPLVYFALPCCYAFAVVLVLAACYNFLRDLCEFFGEPVSLAEF